MSILFNVAVTVVAIGTVGFTAAICSNVKKNKGKAKLTFDELVDVVGTKIDKYVLKKSKQLNSEYLGGKCKISMTTDEFVSVNSKLYFRNKLNENHVINLNYNIPMDSICKNDNDTNMKLIKLKENPLTFDVEP